MSLLNPFSHHRPHFWRDTFIRLGLVLLTTFLIVWFLPRNEQKRFDFAVGEPWVYGTVIAKSDFPLYKTDAAKASEQDSLLAKFQPYYDYDTKVEKQAIARFKESWARHSPRLPADYAEIIIGQLHHFYQTGIMETPTYNALHKDTTKHIRIVFGKDAESVNVGYVYSTMSAYEQLLNDERLAKERALLQQMNLNNYIEPNLIYDKERTNTARNDLLSGISQAYGIVLAGERIITQGDIVTEETYSKLDSWQRAMKTMSTDKTQMTYNVIGNAVYVFILVVLFTIYLALFRKDYFEKARTISMLFSFITLFPILVSLMVQHSYFSFSVYVLPFAFVPIFVRVFMDSRTAFITHLTTILLCACALRYQFDFIVIQVVAGLVAIYSLREMSSRAQVFRTAVWVLMMTCLTYFALKLMESGEDFDFNPSIYSHFVINGVLLLLAYPMMYIVEKLFGFTSVITLIELSDTNKGLLRKLSEVAPGTFQHSITVGNLASEIANRIGAKATLVRTGALYHDIGKIKNPAFFTENQQGGINPHDNLTEKESAQVIIGHVTYGVKLAEEAGLPVVIRDFILTHHGHGLVKYFYIKYQNEHPDEVVDKAPFTYPGPNPYTREQAILMMADTCEAASHALKEYTEEAITQMVNRLVDKQVADGFFKECKITFYDIAVAKQVLIERLKAIYHTRIQYPKVTAQAVATVQKTAQ